MTSRDDDQNPKPGPGYEVGYGRPPRETQFKPGQSGNPKGRKRKPKSVQAQMQAVLSKKVSITEGGKTRHLTIQEVILRNFANKAAKGDLKAALFVFNLVRSPEFADTDAISQASLSPDDQAMFDEMLRHLMGPGGSDPSARAEAADAQSAESDPRADDQESRPAPRNPEDEEGADDD